MAPLIIYILLISLSLNKDLTSGNAFAKAMPRAGQWNNADEADSSGSTAGSHSKVGPGISTSRLGMLEAQLKAAPAGSEIELAALKDIYFLKAGMERTNREKDIAVTIERFIKGIEILKMIYEKILSLDHHFSTITAFQEISAMSNPNSFPEFVKLKEQLKERTRARHKIQLPELLDNNSLFSMGYTLMYSFFGTGNKKERREEIEDISCLLDFTLSMHADLKIIYYETDYLRIQNDNLKSECLVLFDNYLKPVEYKYGLEHCRSNDEWDNIASSLDKLGHVLRDISEKGETEMYTKLMNQLRFSTDLLLDFIQSYSHFVVMGDMYYKKFLTIIQNYESRQDCTGRLPEHYDKLEQEIAYSIEKFETAYNITELKGSKLRDLLYGNP